MDRVTSGWTIESRSEGRWLYLRVSGRPTDLVRSLVDDVMAVAAAQAQYRLVLEFAPEVVFSSLVVGDLVVLHKRVHLKGGALRLCNISPLNQEVIRLMGLSDRFQIVPDLATVLAAS